MTQNAKPIILWDNLLARPGAVITATSSDPDHPVEYLADWREYLTWQAGSGSLQNIELDLGSAQAADTLAIYQHNLHSAGITGVTLYGSDNGTDWTQVVEHPVDSDAPILETFNAAAYRYFKLALAVGGEPAEIGLLFIGGRLQFPSWPASGFDPNPEEQALERARSEEGFLLGTVLKYERRRIQLSFSHLSDSWVRENLIPFWDAHIPRPFLFAWDCLNHPEEIYLVEISEPKRELPYNPVFRSLRLELEGRV